MIGTGEIVGVALAALIVFWMVGAYNRLMRLRGALGQAFTQVDEVLQRRAAAATALVEALREPLHTEAGTLQAVTAGLGAVQRAGDAVRQRPTEGAAVAALAAADAELSSALTRLAALVEHRMELAGDASITPHRAALGEALSRLGFARQLFNDAVGAYNQALDDFPTRLLVRLFRLTPGATL